MISKNRASLHELQSVYGAEDLYKLLEIIAVDAYNEALLMESRK